MFLAPTGPHYGDGSSALLPKGYLVWLMNQKATSPASYMRNSGNKWPDGLNKAVTVKENPFFGPCLNWLWQ